MDQNTNNAIEPAEPKHCLCLECTANIHKNKELAVCAIDDCEYPCVVRPMNAVEDDTDFHGIGKELCKMHGIYNASRHLQPPVFEYFDRPSTQQLPNGYIQPPAHYTCNCIKTLTLEVGSRFGGVDMNIQGVVEKACIEAELERIFHDIDDWTAVESNDAEHSNTLLFDGDSMHYTSTQE